MATQPGPTRTNEVELRPPINSTLEIRVARRPWLLEKLMKPSPKPSIKMDPPRPPTDIPDPPSISRIAPKRAPQNGWVRRGGDAEIRPIPGETDSKGHEKSPSGPSQPNKEAKQQSSNSLRSGNELQLKKPEAESLGGRPDDLETDSAKPVVTDSSPADTEAREEIEPRKNPESKSPARTEGKATATDVPPQEVGTPLGAREGEAAKKADSKQKVTAGEPRVDSVGDLIEKSGQSAKTTDRSKEAVPLDAAKTSRKAASADTSEKVGSDAEEPKQDLDYASFPRTPIRLTSSVYRIKNSLRQCLRYYYARPELANERSNWGMIHEIMVYGADTRILVGKKSYSAIAWIAGNNSCRGQKLLTEQDGTIATKSGVGLQGHQAQMLAVFAQCGVPLQYPLYAGDKRYAVEDIVETEKLACKSGQELTFTLIGLSHYLDTESVWKSADGETWDFERLIREELTQSIVGAACGGTHRLMGFAHALRKRRAEGRPITGQWKRAEVYTRDFVTYAYRLQNRDGSLSTDWFEGREDNGNIDRKIQTTGHMVEWLLTVTPDSRLQDARLVNAIRFLLSSMYNERDHDWKIGPKGHALRSLAMYYERVYQSGPAWQSSTMARTKSNSRR